MSVIGAWARLDPEGRTRFVRRFSSLVQLVLASLTLGTAAIAAQPAPAGTRLETKGPWDSTIRLELFNRLRGEFVDWFAPAPSSPTPEYRYNFLGNKFQLGVRIKRDPIEIFTQFQDSTLDAVPAKAVGIGGTYRANTNRPTQNGAILRQGWLRATNPFGIAGPFVQGGRQLYIDGAEVPASNANLKWIQNNRIAQRLIGPFDYTHVGRSFDGAITGWDSGRGNLTAFYFRPTFGGFEIDANRELNMNVAGVAGTLKDTDGSPSWWLRNTMGRLFWIYYNDDRDIVFVDNRPLAVRQADRGKSSNLHTLGANVAHVEEIGPGSMDGLLYGFWQFGDWQSQYHRAWAYGVETGYRFADVWSSPWMRIGINAASGDQDPNDDLHETFFQMLPTAWLYAMFPFYNMMNNQDVFAQWILEPDPRLTARIDFHWLQLSSSKDLLYSGGGATSNSFYGFAGLPSGGDNDVGYLVHLLLSVRPTSFLTFNALYAHAFGQGVIDASFAGNDGNYGYFETVLSF